MTASGNRGRRRIGVVAAGLPGTARNQGAEAGSPNAGRALDSGAPPRAVLPRCSEGRGAMRRGFSARAAIDLRGWLPRPVLRQNLLAPDRPQEAGEQHEGYQREQVGGRAVEERVV